MFNIFLKSLRDILSPTVLGFIIKVALSSFIVMIALFWLFWDRFNLFIAQLASFMPFVGDYEWFQNGVGIIATPFIAYGIILASISLLTSIFSPKLLIKLAKVNYGIEGSDNSKISEIIKVNLKATLKFFGLTIILLPTLFIPVIGQIIMLYLWAVLLKEPTVYDVVSLFKIKPKSNNRIWITSLIAASFNYIPILNIYSALFAQILFMHSILTQNTNK